MPPSRSSSSTPLPDIFPLKSIPAWCLCYKWQQRVAIPTASDYVDLLEFSAFGGKPWPLAPGVGLPSRWASDLRYTLSTPIPHRYPAVHDRVLNGKRVSAAIAEMAQESNSTVTIAQLRAKAGSFMCEIRASLNRLVCRVCGYLLFKVFRKLCSKLLVVPSQLETIKKAEESGVPIVYLPLHRSHLDYLLITWCNWHFGLRLPHIASGDNLNLSGFGWLLRATGAFFIRRRLSPEDEGGKDKLYRTILHSYIDEILGAKLSLEFFLEGTRSRFGKPLQPKNGLISNVVEAVQQGLISDCYLVPVSITYDQVTEGIFLNELMGIPKERENLWMVLKGMAKGFGMLHCGAVRMNFGTPVLLTEYISSLTACLQHSPPPRIRQMPASFSYRELLPWNAPAVSVDRAIVRGIGLHVLYEAAHIGSIHLSSVVAAVLLCKYREGAERNEVERDIEWFAEHIVRSGCEVVGWIPGRTSGRHAYEYANSFLADSVEVTDDAIRPFQTHHSLVRLAYNRNALLPHMALRSAVALALVSHPVGEPLFVENLVASAHSIAEWMHLEVLFDKPCESLRDRLAYTLVGDDSNWCFACPQTGPVQRIQRESAEDDDSPMVKIRETWQARDLLLFHSNLLRPFLQSYALVIMRLLAEEKPRKEAEFIREAIKAVLANPNDAIYALWLEAVNSDSFRNCLTLLRERGAVNPGSMVTVTNRAYLEQARDQILRILRVDPIAEDVSSR